MLITRSKSTRPKKGRRIIKIVDFLNDLVVLPFLPYGFILGVPGRFLFWGRGLLPLQLCFKLDDF